MGVLLPAQCVTGAKCCLLSGTSTAGMARSTPAARLPLSSSRLAAQQPLQHLRRSPSSAEQHCRHARRRRQLLADAAAADADAGLAAATGEADSEQQQPVQQLAAEAAAALESAVTDAAAEAADDAAPSPKKKSSLAKRVLFGSILGFSGAAVIVTGGWLYGAVACLAAYQLSQVGFSSAHRPRCAPAPQRPLHGPTTHACHACRNSLAS